MIKDIIAGIIFIIGSLILFGLFVGVVLLILGLMFG